MLMRRLVGWVIVRNFTYWNFKTKIFGKCEKDCFAETKSKSDCDMIAGYLKAEVVAVWVGK